MLAFRTAAYETSGSRQRNSGLERSLLIRIFSDGSGLLLFGVGALIHQLRVLRGTL